MRERGPRKVAGVPAAHTLSSAKRFLHARFRRASKTPSQLWAFNFTSATLQEIQQARSTQYASGWSGLFDICARRAFRSPDQKAANVFNKAGFLHSPDL